MRPHSIYCIFLEISPQRHLISWSSLARRHFEGGQISRAATEVLYSTIIGASQSEPHINEMAVRNR